MTCDVTLLTRSDMQSIVIYTLTNLKYTMEVIMMGYLDIPISGISLFSKVSIASEDLPLENLTCLPCEVPGCSFLGNSVDMKTHEKDQAGSHVRLLK